MTTLEKIARLAVESRFDSVGASPGFEIDPVKVEALGRGTKYDLCSSTSTKRKVEGIDGQGDVLRSGSAIHLQAAEGASASSRPSTPTPVPTIASTARIPV